MDLDGFLERTTSGDGFGRDSSWAGGKRQPARCSRKTQDNFAIVSWQRSFCNIAYACMHERTCIFCGECCGVYFNRCSQHHACAGVYVRRVLRTSAYTFANTLATGCAYALMYVQFGHLSLGERGWGGSAGQ